MSKEQRVCRFFWFLRYRNIGTRYVADATPFSLCTVATATFSIATAFGAALGSGMAIMLDCINKFFFCLSFLKKIVFQQHDSRPGYFAALCWFV